MSSVQTLISLPNTLHTLLSKNPPSMSPRYNLKISLQCQMKIESTKHLLVLYQASHCKAINRMINFRFRSTNRLRKKRQISRKMKTRMRSSYNKTSKNSLKATHICYNRLHLKQMQWILSQQLILIHYLRPRKRFFSILKLALPVATMPSFSRFLCRSQKIQMPFPLNFHPIHSSSLHSNFIIQVKLSFFPLCMFWINSHSKAHTLNNSLLQICLNILILTPEGIF